MPGADDRIMPPAVLGNFSSDNHAGAHPAVLAAIQGANEGATPAYGGDPWTARAEVLLADLLGAEAEVFFVYGGTGANVLALQAMTRPHHGIVCAESAHIVTDECGAPERFTGCKVIALPTTEGKVECDQLVAVARAPRSQHGSIPRVVSVSNQTECGTIYTPGELSALAEVAHDAGMLVHLDGARIANAAAALDVPVAALTAEAGVDAMSFGGTKNGLLFGEAVVFFRPALAVEFANVRKQGMQLASKMRFIGAQFEALLTDDLWLHNARHANAMAGRLHDAVRHARGIHLQWDVEGNALFPVLPPAAITDLQREFVFEVWNEETSLCRWMTSWATTPGDVDTFAARIRAVLGDAPPR